MSALPEALRPWAAHLSLFPEDLALSVGAHVARLAAALGPLRARNEMEGGELQGYDGLTRRGSPERLLMSEWLMALEAPDEFVRRAAFGEQAYLRPAYRQPQGGRRTVALLDAGPDQFGSPRIAHLALLVVLARRAEAAGAGFSWAVLQSPPQRVPFSSVDAAAIGRWLKAVSVESPTQARLTGWFEALELGPAPDDVWLVGGSRLSRLPGTERLSRVVVDEVVAPGARRLAVEVRPASRPSRQVVLELPPAPQCVRLLRDPFSTAVAAPVLDSSASTVRALRFSADGLRLLLAHGDGSVVAQALPQSPRATTPRPKRFLLRDEPLLAVGWRRNGGLIGVTQRERNLLVHGLVRGYRGGVVAYPLPEGVSPPEGPWRPGVGPLLAMSQAHQGRECVFLWDAAGVLFQLEESVSWQRSVLPFARGVTTLAERHGSLFYVARHPTEAAAGDALQLGCWTFGKSWQRPLRMEGDGAAYFGYRKDVALDEPGPVLVRQRPERWRVLESLRELDPAHQSPRRMDLSPPPGGRVVGLGPLLPGVFRWPGLVVLGQDQCGFSLVTQDGVAEPLVTASARVVTASLSHTQPVLAWLTETGEVGVWSFQFRALVFRSLPPGGRR